MSILVGTSGWQYADWKGAFYPAEVPKARWLEHYVAQFPTVEVNNAFYRLPDRSTFETWRDRVPEGFVVTVKASRYLTHVKRLSEPAEPVGRLMERASGLGDRLGPILLQLPPSLRIDLGALEETLAQFPKSVRVAVELRHASWMVDETKALLSNHGAAFCLADSPSRRTPLWRTADWGYLRMHEGRASPRPSYGRQALVTWADKLKDLFGHGDAYVYFNNDAGACAPRNAASFIRILESRGLAAAA